LIIALVFEKNANFFAENWEKTQKIVSITSTLDEFVKKVTKMEPNPFFAQNKYITGTVEIRSPKICSTSVILKPLPKDNNRPMGENSHNLVTLAWSETP
jgi:hypothetical protein